MHFDILIHAPRTGTGNLKRLLRSLAAADLAGHNIPHITVELPPTLDTSLERFLYTFQWPKRRLAGSSPNMLTLRHRIQHEKPSAHESAVRLLESFWPADATKSHVLILSPHTEVSPQFFHCKFELANVLQPVLLSQHSAMDVANRSRRQILSPS